MVSAVTMRLATAFLALQLYDSLYSRRFAISKRKSIDGRLNARGRRSAFCREQYNL